MSIKSVADLMVLLFYAKGSSGQQNEEIYGITRLEKLMYLFLREGGFQNVLSKEINYEAYDFGPYSSEIYDLLESLKGMDIVKVREQNITNIKEIVDAYYAEAKGQIEKISGKRMEVYSLKTDRGFRVAKMLLARVAPEEIQRIEDIKKKYNQIALDDLLRYVYTTYPESAKKSKIIENILGFGKRPDLKPFEREEGI
ncbi:MAG: type II toxin-antitoxin system antitoxin SocA domain-containing protein [Thermoplasmata archaeon]